MLDPQRNTGVVCKHSHPLLWFRIIKCVFFYQVQCGYDGLGGRAKFIQPVSFFHARGLLEKRLLGDVNGGWVSELAEIMTYICCRKLV